MVVKGYFVKVYMEDVSIVIMYLNFEKEILMKFDRNKRKKRTWWSKHFAWFPKKALQHVDGDDDKPIWVWLESYIRYWNYGAIVNYVGFELPEAD